MSATVKTVFDSVRQAHATGRLAHAYVIVGSPRGAGAELAARILQLLFCTAAEKPCGRCAACEQVREHTWPDALWVEPEKKSRVIGVEAMRDLTQRITRTAFAGGWKAGVLLFADRLNESSANAFLKTLEEPPGRSLLLLVTDAPQMLLPTIRSRCQRLSVAAAEAAEAPAWQAALLEVLRAGRPRRPLPALVRAARVKAIVEEIKEAVEEAEPPVEVPEGQEVDVKELEELREARVRARVLETRAELLRAFLLWQRDVLLCVVGAPATALHFQAEAERLRAQAQGLTEEQALAEVAAVEQVVRQLERNLPEEAALESAGLAG